MMQETNDTTVNGRKEGNMTEEIKQEIQKCVQEADLVLVGIGTEFHKKNAAQEEIMEAYQKLADLLKEKNYFLLTVNTDDLIFESAIDSERIVAPCVAVIRQAMW